MKKNKNSYPTLPPGIKSVKDIPLPKQINYETSLKLAWEALKETDYARRAKLAGALWNNDGKRFELNILERTITIFPDKEEIIALDGGNLQPWEKIIPLHYLYKADGTEPTGTLISYKEIPDGMLYWQNFVKRTHNIILKSFGNEPQKLSEIAHKIGGLPVELADVSVKIKALPKVDIIIQLWKGDEEFPPQSAFLFDSSITHYLPAEDITVLCQMIAIKLAMMKKQ